MYELSCSRGNLFFHDVFCVFLLLSLVLSALKLTVPEVFGFVTGAALVLSVLMKSNLVRGDLHAFLLNLVSLLEIPFLLLGDHLFGQIFHLALFHLLVFHPVLHGDSLALFWPKAGRHLLFKHLRVHLLFLGVLVHLIADLRIEALLLLTACLILTIDDISVALDLLVVLLHDSLIEAFLLSDAIFMALQCISPGVALNWVCVLNYARVFFWLHIATVVKSLYLGGHNWSVFGKAIAPDVNLALESGCDI